MNIKLDSFDVYGGRPGQGYDGWLGNPFKIGNRTTREDVIGLHRTYFLDRVSRDVAFRDRVLALRGKRVGCFCKPLACHLDVVAEYVNGYFGD